MSAGPVLDEERISPGQACRGEWVGERSREEQADLGPVYEVFITLGQTDLPVEGERRRVTSGMSLTAEVKVGKRRIIEFFVYPLIKYLDEGIKVR